MKVNKKQVGIAMAMSLVLLVLSVAVVKAAPVEQAGTVRLGWIASLVIGLLYYASMSPWFANLGFTVLYRPLIAGALQLADDMADVFRG